MKKAEKYNVWKYPCENIFKWDASYYYGQCLNLVSILCKDKENLSTWDKCPCGKDCKPIKCEIIVRNDVK